MKWALDIQELQPPSPKTQVTQKKQLDDRT